VRRCCGAGERELEMMSMEQKKGSVAAAAVWIALLSVLLCWIPVVGQYLAGRVGARRVGGAGRALAAAAIPAALWAGTLVWLSTRR